MLKDPSKMPVFILVIILKPLLHHVAYGDPTGCIVLLYGFRWYSYEYSTQIKRRESKSSAGVVSLVTYILFIQTCYPVKRLSVYILRMNYTTS